MLLLTNTPILTAYVDETGNTDLAVEKAGASNLYICVAVLVDESQLGPAEAAMQELSADRFGGKEIKSSAIGGNHRRRLMVLSDLCDVDFGYYALIVDKGRVARDSGLQHRTSFYKYLNQALYRRLLTSGVRLHVVADEYGGSAFMDSLQPYLNRKGLPSLFTGFTHCFADSAEEPLIQLADLIAGSLSYVYDPEKQGDHSSELLRHLAPKQIGIGGWPLPPPIPRSDPAQGDDEWDDRIRASCISRAISFEKEFGDEEDEDRQMQIAVLRHLLFLKEYGEDDGYESIFADALIDHLEHLSFPRLNRQSFASRVVGPLRDAGLILAGSNDGYRLATCVKDIRMYLDHDLSLIEPMMGRLKRARENIRHATGNCLDILTLPGYVCLQRLMPAFEEHQLKSVVATETGDRVSETTQETVKA